MPVKDVMIVVGTRPEAIKMAPVVHALKQRDAADGGRTRLCVTAQHREMLDQVLDVFELKPDFDLNLMKPGQDLTDLTARILTGVRDVLAEAKPDAVLVHGDTATCLGAALASFYARVPVGHVEAGLRTYDFDAPWPEEMNRRLVDPICRWCFSPTEAARANLLAERVPKANILVTGNTAIDALQMAAAKVKAAPPPVADLDRSALAAKRLVLVTGHRRESFGPGFEQLCLGLRDIVDTFADAALVYPVHLNPRVQEPVRRLLGGHERIHLIDPQPYLAFVWLMQQAELIVTDSGGIQEEAPSLGKPVLVMRDTTERPEAVEAGAAKLVGTARAKIAGEARRLLGDPKAYAAMAGVRNPYGDGQAAARIADALRR